MSTQRRSKIRWVYGCLDSHPGPLLTCLHGNQDRKPSPGSSRKSGALLFAVIGAKLSEGLNFTDDLARAVIIIGLPFANMASPELRERMNYVNRQEQARGTTRPAGAKDAATELYENMCMNAVNQSIGERLPSHA